jgi:hypothetical protein
LRLRLDFGNNAVLEYEKGALTGVFDPENPLHVYVSFCSFLDSYHIIRQLSRWLWSKTLQRELDAFMAKRNGQKMRKDNAKAGPSNCSRNDAFTMPESHALDNKLLPLDDDQLKIVSELKTAVGGAKLLDFVPPADSVQFEVAYDSLGVAELTMQNAWRIFEALLPLL